MKKHIWIYFLCLLLAYSDASASLKSNNKHLSDDEGTKYSLKKGAKTASPAFDPFEVKISKTAVKTTIATGYYDARLITFGTHLFVRNLASYDLRAEGDDPIDVKLYRQDPQMPPMLTSSQLLFTMGDISHGTSVNTSIKTTTARASECKTTFIQYDKDQAKQHGKDFEIDTHNEKGTANYDGGHLTDHKFSAEGSHTDAFNYVPQHHAYNRWIKESIVKQRTGKAASANAEGYMEIPLYTPNSPEIKVLGEDRYDKIPIGIILVTLKNQAILDAYYFPNNQYNYHVLQRNLGLSRLSGSQIAPYFKLKRALHSLLLPAIIYDGRQHIDLERAQTSTEAQHVYTVDALVEGMSALNLDDDKTTLSTLASQTLFQENVDISNVLNLSKWQIAALKNNQPSQTALNQSFNVLGQFLVEYAMGNALKSEVLKPTSRIMFLNIMIDFFDNHYQFEGTSLKALDYVHSKFLTAYATSLSSLEEQHTQMNLRDLLYFANLYVKLSTESMHAAFVNGYGVGDDFMDIDDNFFRFIQILKTLSKTVKKQDLTSEQRQNLVELFSQAQENLSYVITTLGGSHAAQEINPNISEVKKFLKKMKSRVLAWDKKEPTKSGAYQTSPKSVVYYRGENGINKHALGSNSSLIYPNSESDEDAGSDEDTGSDEEYI